MVCEVSVPHAVVVMMTDLRLLILLHLLLFSQVEMDQFTVGMEIQDKAYLARICKCCHHAMSPLLLLPRKI